MVCQVQQAGEPTIMPPPIDPSRDLLFGLLALQNGLINQAQLVAAFQAWTLDKTHALADHLIALGHLNGGQRAVVEAMAALHVAKHGDVERSLSAIPAGRSTHESLARLGDPDIEGTLAHVRSRSTQQDGESEADRTATYSVGSGTSDGLRFRVLRPHARGALGAVFVALDTELHREVALKQILDEHADDPVSRQRFLLEAEVTGGLEHPGIVPVYGLGTYADGRPYYAMRFVRGESLKEAVDRFHADLVLKSDPGRRSLELRKLLRRFTDVCNAIDYAHSRGILHRDIKPANVILGQHGETLVVDWGLAKPVGRTEPRPDAAERTLVPSSAGSGAETLPGSALGTPAYMSPEQAAGNLERLGPQSDVYSLGATLYCLLTGKPPLGGDDIGELLRRAQRGDVTPPRQLDPSIDKALEATCLKAMATQPEDRYQSCRVLAEDIERWMADEPVAAWREPWTCTLLRWLTRHRTGVTGAAAAVLAGVVGLTAVLAVQAAASTRLLASLARETNARTALAVANADLTHSQAAVQARYDLAVEAIKTFHTGVSEDFLVKQDQFKEMRDRLLKSASDFYGKLGALLGTETDAASRRALAQANFELAELTAKVGRDEDALVMHRAVLAAREALAAETAADDAVKVEVGQSLTAIAFLLDLTGNKDQALRAYRKAEEHLARLGDSSPAAAPARAALAYCRAWLGWLLHTMGRSEESLAALRLARLEQEATAGAPGATAQARKELADTFRIIGGILFNTGKVIEAETAMRKALLLYRELADGPPANAERRSNQALMQWGLAAALVARGKLKEAESEYRATLALQQKLADDNPAVTYFRDELAHTHEWFGDLLLETGKTAEAEVEYRAALALCEKLVAGDPKLGSELVIAQLRLGDLLLLKGRPSEAETEFRTALALSRKLADDNPADPDSRLRLAGSHRSLGHLLLQTGRPSQAEAEFRNALAIQQKLADDNPAATDFRGHVANGHDSLGNLLRQTGKPALAEAEYRAALALQQKLADNNPAANNFRSGLADSHVNLGRLLTETGKPAPAEAEFRTALALFRKLADDNPQDPRPRDAAAHVDNKLSVALRRLGRPTDARVHCERAVSVRDALVKEHPSSPRYRRGLAENHLNRGLTRRVLGDPAGAAADVRRALALFDALPSRSGGEWECEKRFIIACCQAALADMAYQAGSGVSAGEAASEADKAMALLRQAVGMGYRNAAAFCTEDALDPLRGREDFRLMMMDLAMPDEPFAKHADAGR
jgi:serine/threonine-protein kinase